MPFESYYREVDYLRISFTDTCNLRCAYCTPEQMTFRPREELPFVAQQGRLIRLFGGDGFRKTRSTDGEPTLHASLLELVRHATGMLGIKAISLTNHRVLLARLSLPLCDAGLWSVDLSSATLAPEKFRRVACWGRLDTEGNCASGSVFGSALGVFGVTQFAQALKLLLARLFHAEGLPRVYLRIGADGPAPAYSI